MKNWQAVVEENTLQNYNFCLKAWIIIIVGKNLHMIVRTAIMMAEPIFTH